MSSMDELQIGAGSEAYHGPAPTNEKLGLSFRRTDDKTRSRLQEQRGPKDWEPIERMREGTIGADVVVDASCPCPPVSCRCIHNGTNQA
jgi:hypothetical protein